MYTAAAARLGEEPTVHKRASHPHRAPSHRHERSEHLAEGRSTRLIVSAKWTGNTNNATR